MGDGPSLLFIGTMLNNNGPLLTNRLKTLHVNKALGFTATNTRLRLVAIVFAVIDESCG